jgi:hypothetical protein
MAADPKQRSREAAEGDGSPAVWDRIEGFHRTMAGLLRELDTATDPARIREVVDTLDRSLPAHFEDEVGPGGLFEDLGSRRPASEPILEHLRKDHGEILGMVSALNRRLQELDPADPRIQQGRRAVLEKIRSHERIENRRVRDTYMVDEGGLG